MKKGIICLETEWQLTVKKNQLPLHTEPLLDFLGKAYGCNYWYRRIATKAELQFYLRRFGYSKFDDYKIFYFSFHGNTRSISLEGEKPGENIISLDDLAKMAGHTFENKIVHFSSCRTLLGNIQELEKFKKITKASLVSGYTTSVDGIKSAINDLAYFDQIFSYQNTGCVEAAMQKYYEGLGKELGFKII